MIRIAGLVALLVLAGCAVPDPPPLPPPPPGLTPAGHADAGAMRADVRQLQVWTCEAVRHHHPLAYAAGAWRSTCGRP